MKYQFEYWGDLDKRLRDKSSELDAPEKAIDLIMKYYGVPKELREKLFARVLLSFDQNYLIQIGIWGANDATKYPQEFSTHKAMVQKNCEAVRQHFDSYCGTTHDLSRSQPQVIVNVKDQKVVPVPVGVKSEKVQKPSGEFNFKVHHSDLKSMTLTL